MARSIKFSDDTYLDASGVVFSDRKTLESSATRCYTIRNTEYLNPTNNDIENLKSAVNAFPNIFSKGNVINIERETSYTYATVFVGGTDNEYFTCMVISFYLGNNITICRYSNGEWITKQI